MHRPASKQATSVDLYGWKKSRSSERLEEEERDCRGSILSSPGLEKKEDSWQEESNHVEEEITNLCKYNTLDEIGLGEIGAGDSDSGVTTSTIREWRKRGREAHCIGSWSL
jgi:hypothetical protein